MVRFILTRLAKMALSLLQKNDIICDKKITNHASCQILIIET